MAYTEKYFVSFCNPLGQSCRVSILQDNFIGVATELVGQEDPIVIAYDNSDDFKFKGVIESEASINLVFNDETLSFSELWNSNEKTFLVKYTIEDALEWTGFIIPEGLDYNLKGGSYDAVLTARDGLATLEGILFKTDNNDFYGFQDFGYNNAESFPFILVITEILRKLDLGIDIWTLVDYYEQTMSLLNTDSRDSDPLAISYVNVKTYINDTDRTDIPYFQDVNEAWDCQKIIENICNIWGARLYQERGVWKFKSVHADKSIAIPHSTETDPFVGANPTLAHGLPTGFTWRYNCYYSLTIDVDLDSNALFYSNYNTVAVNDKVFQIIDTIPSEAIAGFYLIKGKNKLIEIGDNGIVISIRTYQDVVTNYYWKKYNNTAGYLGRELANAGTVIPCFNKDAFLKDNDATIRMDKVYKQFRVNHTYTFIRTGDGPVNLLKNGNFALPFNQYGGLEAPPNWERWHFNTSKLFPRGRVNTLNESDKLASEGNTNALEFSVQYGDANTPNTDPNPAVWAAFVQKGIVIDQKTTALTFEGWVNYAYSGNNKRHFPVYRAILFPTVSNAPEGKIEFYTLVNAVSEDFDLEWQKREIFADGLNGLIDSEQTLIYFQTYAQMSSLWSEAEQASTKWYDFKLRIQEPPKFGTIDFYIHGLCADQGKKSNTFPPFQSWRLNGNTTEPYSFPTISNQALVVKPQFTGLNLGYIPDADAEVPKTDYIYANGDINYTFQDDPIQVYNGDTVDPEIVSAILVPTNLSGFKNKWDTFNNEFGKSDIGMILCKSIMQQYYTPNRLLDCEFKSDNYKYGDIISFEHIPDVKFIMLRGSFNSKRGYWEGCTLAQISSDSINPGGITNGDSLSPIWQETGNTRCVKDENGENTGESEYEIQDINSNSDSFGDFRWKSSGENLTMCPIGEPSRFFWGTDADVYNVANFKDYTITYEDASIGMIQVSYSNTGGKYIYFLHLASLGSVVQISNQHQSQIISSFTYLDDVTINGYLYRVLRQNFVTSEFTNFLLTFYIQ